ncbi:minor tail protein [Mycobacterium phage Rose5]|nr:hypothetical protein [Mycobacterium phage Fezzik]AZS12174.1 minor tail protein [Mycobacterium phage Acquire49]QGJ92426.1 minor tail protein [Mycobacterium phage Wyatt2]QWT30549.1 minor tail protein [Mycobacterium phage Rose5]
MTMPNGDGGLDDGAWLAPFVAQNDLSTLTDRTEANIRAYYADLVQIDPGWGEASETFFNFIMAGFNTIGDVMRAIVNAITGIPGNLADLGTWMGDRWGDLADALSATGQIIDALANKVGAGIHDAIQRINSFLTSLSPLNAGNLFGGINITQLPLLSVSHIANVQPELLTNGGFDTDESVSANDEWEWDGEVGRTSPYGSVRIEADGTQHELVSGPNAILVAAGQELDLSVWVTQVDAVGSGARAQLYVRPYTDGVAGTAVQIAQAAVPTTWAKLSGTYTVPSGVDSIRLVLRVTSNATAGTFWFDDASVKKKGLMSRGLVDGLEMLHTAFNQVMEILGGAIVTPINSAVQAVKDWWNAVAGKVQNLTLSGILPSINVGSPIGGINIGQDLLDTWNRIVNGFRRTSTTGNTSADVEEIMATVGQEILVAQESTITLANQANAPKNVAFWESPNPFEDVSFPRALLQPQLQVTLPTSTARSSLSSLPANWTASVADTVEAHTHQITNGSTTYVKPTYTIPAGTLALSAVRIKQDRIVNVARFIAGGGTPPSTALYVGLYAIDPTNGNMTLVYDFGDQKGNVNTGSALYETAVTLPNDLLVDGGTLFAVGILPVGSAFSVAAIRRSPIVTSALVYPQAATELLTGQTSLPSTVTESSLNHASDYRVWVSIGQAVDSIPEDVSPVTLSMNFDVSNTLSWSSPSFQQFGTSGSRFGIDSGNIFADAPAFLLGDETYWRSALCLTPVHTNNHSVGITIGSGWNTNTYGYTTTRAYVRMNSQGTSGVAMHLDSAGSNVVRIRIANVSNMTSVGTVRATATCPFSVGDEFTIAAVGSVYQVFRNGVAVPGAVWDDTTSIVPVGKAWRRHGFGGGSRNVSAYTIHRSAYIDRYKAMDLSGS